MDPVTTSALLTAGGAAGSQVGAGVLGYIGQERQRAWEEQQAAVERSWNESMLDKQNAFSLNMWNKANEYNKPSEQYQRLLDAGLNPLFYGLDGTGNTGAMQSAQILGSSRPTGVPNGLSVAAPYAGALAESVARIANIQADTAKKSNETLTETQRRENMTVELKKIQQEIQNIAADERLTDAQRYQVELATSWIDRMNEANLAYTESQSKLNDSVRNRIDKLLEGELKIQAQTFEDFEHQWKLIEGKLRLIASQANLLDKDVENYALNHMQSGIFGSGVSTNNILRMLGFSDEDIRRITGDVPKDMNLQGDPAFPSGRSPFFKKKKSDVKIK